MRWRPALWLLPLLVTLVTVRAWCGRTAPPTVQAVAARQAPLRVAVSTNGKVEPVDDIEVRARLDGRVVRIPDPGKVVVAGDEMVRLDDGPVAGQLAAARPSAWRRSNRCGWRARRRRNAPSGWPSTAACSATAP
ncbi:MAG: hypothetical protein U0802_03195 [Candidatus Binatia bacterium]